jgi:hypothetical protein
MTPEWQQAVRRGDIAELAALLSRGADVDARDKYGQTGVMLAATAGNPRVVEWLALHGADLDHTAKYGLSAVMLAALRGHTEVVRILVAAGANLDQRGAGAPGFAGKTAYDLAAGRGDDATAALLAPPPSPSDVPDPHPRFLAPETWDAVRPLVDFTPRVATETLGAALRGLRVHVRDHRRRDLPRRLRSVEAHYETFAVAQSQPGALAARRSALEVSYGREPAPVRVSGHHGRAYALGPEVPPGDIDGRSPAVVTWHDGPAFFFVLSSRLPVEEIMKVAVSLYPRT